MGRQIRIDLEELARQYGVVQLFDARIETPEEPTAEGDPGDWFLVLEAL